MKVHIILNLDLKKKKKAKTSLVCVLPLCIVSVDYQKPPLSRDAS